jgi:hypothetical protein
MPSHNASIIAQDSRNVIDGRAIAAQTLRELVQRVSELKRHGLAPGLAFVRVGEDAASKVYVGRKEKACEELDIFSETHVLPEKTSEAELLALIAKLNSDPRLHGILVQAPLPKHIRESKIYSAVSPVKDVDGFHPVNVGKLMLGDPTGLPALHAGGHRRTARALGRENRRRGSRRAGPRQHCRQTDGGDALSKSQERQRDGDDLPFGDARHYVALPARGHFDRRDGRRRIREGRHGQARRGGD